MEASIQQNKLQAVLSTIERFSDESFNLNRRKVREIITKHQADAWKEFAESEDDYLIRGFLSLYETTAYQVRMGMADVKTVAGGMGPLIGADWLALKPAVEYYRKTWDKKDAYAHFEELEQSISKYTTENAV